MKNNHLRLTDALQGTISLKEGNKKYFKTKDSSSKSGHSLITQIEMTHSGIVTRNYGFYLPTRMSDGAKTFTQNFPKPVIIGHEDESTPVGRVIEAEYVNSSADLFEKDSFLKNLSRYSDSLQATTDFVQHMIREYCHRDGYTGTGFIRGTLKIDDPETIERILDQRYMTVSTSMISPDAYCSVCGTNWMKDGFCEHQRGNEYKDNLCVVVPGAMSYEHLGIVNSPADPNAHTFSIVNEQEVQIIHVNSAERNSKYNNFEDSINTAIQVFAAKDNSLIPLFTEEEVNLVEVKDSIEKMENAMKVNKTKEELKALIKDAVVSSYFRIARYEEGKADKEVTVSQWINTEEEEFDKESVLEAIAAYLSENGVEGEGDNNDQLDLQKGIQDFLIENHGFVEIKDEEGQNQDEGTQNDAATKSGNEGSSDCSPTQTRAKNVKKKKKTSRENSQKRENDSVLIKAYKDAYEGEDAISDLGNDALSFFAQNLKYWNIPDSVFNEDELKMGTEVEKEHNDNENISKAIAKSHLMEIPDYYTRLKKMEEEGKAALGITDSTQTIEKFLDSKTVEEISEAIDELIKRISASQNINISEKDAKEILQKIADKDEETLFLYSGLTEDELAEVLTELNSTETTLEDMSAEEVYDVMKEFLPEESAISEDAFKELKASDCCGKKGFFPLVNEDHYAAIVETLEVLNVADSVKKRILDSAKKKASRQGYKLNKNFDTANNTCNNTEVVTRTELDSESLVKVLDALNKKASEAGLNVNVTSDSANDVSDLMKQLNDRAQEISILEAQLVAANEEINVLEDSFKQEKAKMSSFVAEKIIDSKIQKGEIEENDRAKFLDEFSGKSLDTLQNEFINLVSVKKESVPSTPAKVENPVLDSNENATFETNKQREEAKESSLYRQYSVLVERRGRAFADAWMRKQKIKVLD